MSPTRARQIEGFCMGDLVRWFSAPQLRVLRERENA
jgi:hypothetical protein